MFLDQAILDGCTEPPQPPELIDDTPEGLLSWSLTTEEFTAAARRALNTSFIERATATNTTPGNLQPTQRLQPTWSRTTGRHYHLVSALLLHQ